MNLTDHNSVSFAMDIRSYHAKLNDNSADASVIPTTGGKQLACLVETIIHQRRVRERYLPGDLFAEPAWDILLVLFLAETRQQRISVSQVRNHFSIPSTTALRWITSLTNAGFIVRRDDPLDRRRKFLELTPETSAAMCAYCWSTASPERLAA